MGSRVSIPATGIVLAGGKSSRFGRDKALEVVAGKTLIQRILEVFESMFPRLLIIANQPRKYAHLGVDIKRDLIPGLGPLGGLYTGLHFMKDSWGFFAACDMPFINPALVRHMAELRAGWEVVVPRVGDKIEPLHAFYSRRCLQPVRQLIDSGARQIFRFYQEVRVRYVEEEEIRRYDPAFKSFFNINWPQDLLVIGSSPKEPR